MFYSIYLVDGSVELHLLGQEHVAKTRQGRLISTQKDYQSAREFASTLAKDMQLPLVDRTQ